MKPPIEFRVKRFVDEPVKAGEAFYVAIGGEPQDISPIKFDRNAYQREYMRRYRAKKKGEK